MEFETQSYSAAFNRKFNPQIKCRFS